MISDVRLAALAALLIAGELAGFACAPVASAWPWAAAFTLLLALAAWGWSLRHMLPVLVFLFGVIAAARTETQRVAVIERRWIGTRTQVDLTVDGAAWVGHSKKCGPTVEFTSHLGPVPVKVIIPYDGHSPLPVCGEVWRCSGAISYKKEDSPRFERLNFWANGSASARRVAETPPIRRAIDALSKACSERMGIGLGWCPRIAAINRAILLGRRAELPSALRQRFVNAGTVHVFAISGLHVMMIVLLLVRAMLAVRMPIQFCGLVVVPVLIVYVVLTGVRPSAVRAATMASIYLSAPALGRKGNALSAWATTALLVYGRSPERLFNIGCTFSFAVMLGIVFWLYLVHPYLPCKVRDGWMAGLGCGVSLAAWVSGVPIAARSFKLFTLGGLVANLAVLPLAALTVAFGLAGAIVGFVLPPAAAVFNNLAAASTFLMVQVSNAVSSVPGAWFQVHPWSPGACAAWYAVWMSLSALMARLLSCRRTGSEPWWR